jgi:HTH-type transcriptional regulator/antitoxin HigA
MGRAMVQNEYWPDTVSPPGDTLLELLEERGMSQAELARRTGRPTKTINEIVQGKTAITPETALQLERVLGTPASFWNRRERHYREALARRDEENELAGHLAWLDNIPVRDMADRGWIEWFDDRVQQLREVLGFFGIASPEQWEALWARRPAAAFRQSPAYQADPFAVAAWLREGERQAQHIGTAPFNADAFRAVLNDIRRLTTEPPDVFQPRLQTMCAQVGVAVVFVPQLEGTRASGAAYWLTPDKALIQLSLRYRRNDHLWFTFFHEAGHILEHGKRDVFLEDAEEDAPAIDADKEAEANQFAADILIPPGEWCEFIEQVRAVQPRVSKQMARDFAARAGIAPGIVAGRLQREGEIPYSYFHELFVRLDWEN